MSRIIEQRTIQIESREPAIQIVREKSELGGHVHFRGTPIYDLNGLCDTCDMLFRYVASKSTGNVVVCSEPLEKPLSIEMGKLEKLAPLFPSGEYLVNLLEVRPKVVHSGDADDYDKIICGGSDDPILTGIDYYRESTTDLAQHIETYAKGQKSKLRYEALMPLYPPAKLNDSAVEKYAERILAGETVTALSLSILNVSRGRHTSPFNNVVLTHFLLDGHHKVAAAARLSKAVHLLSFLSLGESLPSDTAELSSALGTVVAS